MAAGQSAIEIISCCGDCLDSCDIDAVLLARTAGVPRFSVALSVKSV
jgi:hypothetical protein